MANVSRLLSHCSEWWGKRKWNAAALFFHCLWPEEVAHFGSKQREPNSVGQTAKRANPENALLKILAELPCYVSMSLISCSFKKVYSGTNHNFFVHKVQPNISTSSILEECREYRQCARVRPRKHRL